MGVERADTHLRLQEFRLQVVPDGQQDSEYEVCFDSREAENTGPRMATAAPPTPVSSSAATAAIVKSV